jgi:hypothetical protein
VTAGTIMLILLAKMAVGAAIFIVLVSFGLWLGRIGFGGEIGVPKE